eukprot:COSAG06_NODE_5135_length_3692_cov_3.408016_4_plen_131_part_00
MQGKSLLLSHLFSQLKSTNVATIHCSALTNAVHVIQKLSQARHTHSKRFGAASFCRKGTCYAKTGSGQTQGKQNTITKLAFLFSFFAGMHAAVVVDWARAAAEGSRAVDPLPEGFEPTEAGHVTNPPYTQ